MTKILRNFGKKKKLCLFFLVIETLLITNCVIGAVTAFGNGKDLTGTFDAYSPSFVSDWWAGDHYGTHDWVAQAALEAVKTHLVAGPKWMKNDVSFWNKRRETIFLIGTEAPDANSLQLNGRLNGEKAQGLHDVGSHHLFFHDTDTLPIELRMKPRFYTFDISRVVIRATEKVKDYLREGKCDLAAFYLGTIAHYITDVAGFLAVLQENIEVKTEIIGEKKRMHGKFEDHMNVAMNDPKRRERYFDYDITFNVSSRDPWECVKTVAFDTRWDLLRDNIDFVDTTTLNPGSQDAVWFYTSFRSWMISLEPYQRATVNDWPPALKTRIGALMQRAIEYVAHAIDFVAGSWAELGKIGIEKHCDECNSGNDNVPDQAIKVVKYASLMVSSLLFMGLALSNLLPVIYIVVPLVSRGKELEALSLIGG